MKKIKVSFLTEQISHHPPVSAFIADCSDKGISVRGYDQIKAKFTGISVKVTPGEYNSGFYITLKKRGNEEYHLTHPAAHIGGLLRGSLNVTVCEQCYITCEKTGIKTILTYLDGGWIGKSQNKVEGVVFKYDPNDDNIMKINEVPEDDILARINGSWKEIIYFSLGANSKPQIPLIDVTNLDLPEKIVPPMSQQLNNESRNQWSGVTDAINAREYGKATKLKLELEEKQRLKVNERETSGCKWTPKFFIDDLTPNGKPELSSEGKEVLSRLSGDNWVLEEKTESNS